MKQEIPQINQEADETQEKFARCPYCEAVFKLHQSKLDVRGGEVRCGACRDVFNANLHFVVRNSNGVFVALDQAAEVSAEALVPPQGEIINPLREMIAQNLSRTEKDDVSPPPSFEDDSSIDEDTCSSRNTGTNAVTGRLEFPFEPSVDHDRSVEWTIDAEQQLEEAVVETYMEHRPTQRQESGEPILDQPRPTSRANWFSAEPDSLYDNNPFSAPGDTESSVVVDDQRPSIVNTSDVDEYITDRPNPLLGIFWLLVCIAFVGLLGLQVKYYFVEKFAQNETIRPYLGVFCGVARCELPPRRDPYRFTITHTRIDLHPREPGALRITVKLLNQAKFTQPYPDLLLTLTDRVGRVVGRRTFPPTFYLGEEQQTILGSGELGSVAFDLAHPHEKAVGFVVDIVRNPGV